ncbi:MAG: hypothetical protein ACJ8DQ_11375, partial [Xanthobacteraceae bacterium]
MGVAVSIRRGCFLLKGKVITLEVPQTPPPLEKGRSPSPALSRTRRVGIIVASLDPHPFVAASA